ncbi:MAG: hypothetical protein J6N32_14115 [Clostridia bacterium]|nr:hypothetical protein [Clostridia bacterium]
MDIQKLKEFSAPYYKDKDIMHNLWHIELVEKWIDRILHLGNYTVDSEAITYALYFHGFIYSDEEKIKQWLTENHVRNIDKILKISWESQRPEVPETLEGKILHDAHVLEGGKTYLVVKTLLTGSVRGQTLTETVRYLKEHVIDHNHCYLPETIGLCDEMNEYAKQFVNELEKGIL